MSAQAGWSGSGQDAGGIAKPAAAAQEVLRAFTNLVASSSRSKADLRDFEKLLVSCDDRCMSALLAHPQLWPLLRASLSNYESQWDVLGLLLNRLSMEAEGRKQAMAQGYINMMGELLAVRGPQARADKAIERLGNLACMLSVLCTDASVAQLPWLHSVCMGVRNSLDRSQIKNASGRVVMEAYAQLSAFINFLYTSVPSLARHIATCFINCSESTPLLFRVAKRLVDEPGLTGATKVRSQHSSMHMSNVGRCSSSLNIMCAAWHQPAHHTLKTWQPAHTACAYHVPQKQRYGAACRARQRPARSMCHNAAACTWHQLEARFQVLEPHGNCTMALAHL